MLGCPEGAELFQLACPRRSGIASQFVRHGGCAAITSGVLWHANGRWRSDFPCCRDASPLPQKVKLLTLGLAERANEGVSVGSYLSQDGKVGANFVIRAETKLWRSVADQITQALEGGASLSPTVEF